MKNLAKPKTSTTQEKKKFFDEIDALKAPFKDIVNSLKANENMSLEQLQLYTSVASSKEEPQPLITSSLLSPIAELINFFNSIARIQAIKKEVIENNTNDITKPEKQAKDALLNSLYHLKYILKCFIALQENPQANKKELNKEILIRIICLTRKLNSLGNTYALANNTATINTNKFASILQNLTPSIRNWLGSDSELDTQVKQYTDFPQTLGIAKSDTDKKPEKHKIKKTLLEINLLHSKITYNNTSINNVIVVEETFDDNYDNESLLDELDALEDEGEIPSIDFFTQVPINDADVIKDLEKLEKETKLENLNTGKKEIISNLKPEQPEPSSRLTLKPKHATLIKRALVSQPSTLVLNLTPSLDRRWELFRKASIAVIHLEKSTNPEEIALLNLFKFALINLQPILVRENQEQVQKFTQELENEFGNISFLLQSNLIKDADKIQAEVDKNHELLEKLDLTNLFKKNETHPDLIALTSQDLGDLRNYYNGVYLIKKEQKEKTKSTKKEKKSNNKPPDYNKARKIHYRILVTKFVALVKQIKTAIQNDPADYKANNPELFKELYYLINSGFLLGFMSNANLTTNNDPYLFARGKTAQLFHQARNAMLNFSSLKNPKEQFEALIKSLDLFYDILDSENEVTRRAWQFSKGANKKYKFHFDREYKAKKEGDQNLLENLRIIMRLEDSVPTPKLPESINDKTDLGSFIAEPSVQDTVTEISSKTEVIQNTENSTNKNGSLFEDRLLYNQYKAGKIPDAKTLFPFQATNGETPAPSNGGDTLRGGANLSALNTLAKNLSSHLTETFEYLQANETAETQLNKIRQADYSLELRDIDAAWEIKLAEIKDKYNVEFPNLRVIHLNVNKNILAEHLANERKYRETTKTKPQLLVFKVLLTDAKNPTDGHWVTLAVMPDEKDATKATFLYIDPRQPSSNSVTPPLIGMNIAKAYTNAEPVYINYPLLQDSENNNTQIQAAQKEACGIYMIEIASSLFELAAKQKESGQPVNLAKLELNKSLQELERATRGISIRIYREGVASLIDAKIKKDTLRPKVTDKGNVFDAEKHVQSKQSQEDVVALQITILTTLKKIYNQKKEPTSIIVKDAKGKKHQSINPLDEFSLIFDRLPEAIKNNLYSNQSSLQEKKQNFLNLCMVACSANNQDDVSFLKGLNPEQLQTLHQFLVTRAYNKPLEVSPAASNGENKNNRKQTADYSISTLSSTNNNSNNKDNKNNSQNNRKASSSSSNMGGSLFQNLKQGFANFSLSNLTMPNFFSKSKQDNNNVVIPTSPTPNIINSKNNSNGSTTNTTTTLTATTSNINNTNTTSSSNTNSIVNSSTTLAATNTMSNASNANDSNDAEIISNTSNTVTTTTIQSNTNSNIATGVTSPTAASLTNNVTKDAFPPLSAELQQQFVLLQEKFRLSNIQSKATFSEIANTHTSNFANQIAPILQAQKLLQKEIDEFVAVAKHPLVDAFSIQTQKEFYLLEQQGQLLLKSGIQRKSLRRRETVTDSKIRHSTDENQLQIFYPNEQNQRSNDIANINTTASSVNVADDSNLNSYVDLDDEIILTNANLEAAISNIEFTDKAALTEAAVFLANKARLEEHWEKLNKTRENNSHIFKVGMAVDAVSTVASIIGVFIATWTIGFSTAGLGFLIGAGIALSAFTGYLLYKRHKNKQLKAELKQAKSDFIAEIAAFFLNDPTGIVTTVNGPAQRQTVGEAILYLLQKEKTNVAEGQNFPKITLDVIRHLTKENYDKQKVDELIEKIAGWDLAFAPKRLTTIFDLMIETNVPTSNQATPKETKIKELVTWLNFTYDNHYEKNNEVDLSIVIDNMKEENKVKLIDLVIEAAELKEPIRAILTTLRPVSIQELLNKREEEIKEVRNKPAEYKWTKNDFAKSFSLIDSYIDQRLNNPKIAADKKSEKFVTDINFVLDQLNEKNQLDKGGMLPIADATNLTTCEDIFNSLEGQDNVTLKNIIKEIKPANLGKLLTHIITGKFNVSFDIKKTIIESLTLTPQILQKSLVAARHESKSTRQFIDMLSDRLFLSLKNYDGPLTQEAAEDTKITNDEILSNLLIGFRPQEMSLVKIDAKQTLNDILTAHTEVNRFIAASILDSNQLIARAKTTLFEYLDSLRLNEDDIENVNLMKDKTHLGQMDVAILQRIINHADHPPRGVLRAMTKLHSQILGRTFYLATKECILNLDNEANSRYFSSYYHKTPYYILTKQGFDALEPGTVTPSAKTVRHAFESIIATDSTAQTQEVKENIIRNLIVEFANRPNYQQMFFNRAMQSFADTKINLYNLDIRQSLIINFLNNKSAKITNLENVIESIARWFIDTEKFSSAEFLNSKRLSSYIELFKAIDPRSFTTMGVLADRPQNTIQLLAAIDKQKPGLAGKIVEDMHQFSNSNDSSPEQQNAIQLILTNLRITGTTANPDPLKEDKEIINASVFYELLKKAKLTASGKAIATQFNTLLTNFFNNFKGSNNANLSGIETKAVVFHSIDAITKYNATLKKKAISAEDAENITHYLFNYYASKLRNANDQPAENAYIQFEMYAMCFRDIPEPSQRKILNTGYDKTEFGPLFNLTDKPDHKKITAILNEHFSQLSADEFGEWSAKIMRTILQYSPGEAKKLIGEKFIPNLVIGLLQSNIANNLDKIKMILWQYVSVLNNVPNAANNLTLQQIKTLDLESTSILRENTIKIIKKNVASDKWNSLRKFILKSAVLTDYFFTYPELKEALQHEIEVFNKPTLSQFQFNQKTELPQETKLKALLTHDPHNKMTRIANALMGMSTRMKYTDLNDLKAKPITKDLSAVLTSFFSNAASAKDKFNVKLLIQSVLRADYCSGDDDANAEYKQSIYEAILVAYYENVQVAFQKGKLQNAVKPSSVLAEIWHFVKELSRDKHINQFEVDTFDTSYKQIKLHYGLGRTPQAHASDTTGLISGEVVNYGTTTVQLEPVPEEDNQFSEVTYEEPEETTQETQPLLQTNP